MISKFQSGFFKDIGENVNCVLMGSIEMRNLKLLKKLMHIIKIYVLTIHEELTYLKGGDEY